MVMTAVSHAMYSPLHVIHVKNVSHVAGAACGRNEVNPAF